MFRFVVYKYTESEAYGPATDRAMAGFRQVRGYVDDSALSSAITSDDTFSSICLSVRPTAITISSVNPP